MLNGEGRNRTGDTTIFSRVLYQLSYLAAVAAARGSSAGQGKASAPDREAGFPGRQTPGRGAAAGSDRDSCRRRGGGDSGVRGDPGRPAHSSGAGRGAAALSRHGRRRQRRADRGDRRLRQRRRPAAVRARRDVGDRQPLLPPGRRVGPRRHRDRRPGRRPDGGRRCPSGGPGGSASATSPGPTSSRPPRWSAGRRSASPTRFPLPDTSWSACSGCGGPRALRSTSGSASIWTGVREACVADPPAQTGGGDVETFAWSGTGAIRASLECDFGSAARTPGPISAAARSDRRWLARSRPLGPGAPAWARRLYGRSLLVLRALTDRRTGAVAAGERDGWAYVWPRDAAAAAIALCRRRAPRPGAPDRRLPARSRHLRGGPLPRRRRGRRGRAPRSGGRGRLGGRRREGGRDRLAPIPAGAFEVGATGPTTGRATGGGTSSATRSPPGCRRRGSPRCSRPRRDSCGAPAAEASGLDSSAAWAVRPFPRPALFGAVRASLDGLGAGRYGLRPGEGFPGHGAWTAPTAWTAWSLAALGERRRALRMLAAVRRAATPAGTLPERVDEKTGLPESTTPLAWSHAFTVLALRELWPRRSR